jgi:serine protease Do
MERLLVLVLVLLATVSCCIVPPVESDTIVEDKFENMVNAAVVVHDTGSPGYGSGVFIYDDVIVTAAHCLQGRDSVDIELVDGTVIESADLYIDEEEDVGFVAVDVDEIAIATISEIPCSLGDTIYLVGAPHDVVLKFSLSKGIVSHTDRDVFIWDDLIQADASGGPGSSGGPLYDSNGNVVGICVASPPSSGGCIILAEDMESILAAYERYQETKKSSD